MGRFTLLFIWLLVFSKFSLAQSQFDLFFKPSDSLHIPRKNTIILAEATTATAALVGLHQLWYADYEKSRFHTINDNNEWLQMDKLGHVFSSYQMGRMGAGLLHWSGVSKKDQLIYGSTLGFAFLTVVEVFDGYSQEWGFSWGDVLANVSGTALYTGQELLWDEQRILLKFSFHQTRYAEQNPDKLGDGFLENVLKDYNGQTYWLSANLQAFFKESKLPKWLNVAFGYGADGMLTGMNNTDNELLADDSRFRQYYLSLDVDLSRIKTKSNVLKAIFSTLNFVKIPLPTLEFSKKRCVFHLFYN